MTSPIDSPVASHESTDSHGVEMPRATAWPIVLAVGITLLCAGLVLSPVISIVGAVLFVFGLGGWVGQLLPGRGHMHEPLVEPSLRALPVKGKPGTTAQLGPGMVGYRFQLPLKIHPISAGIKGGIVGGLLMPIPALAYGLISHNSIWFPINLLAGMVVPGISGASRTELDQFHLGALILGICIHATFSVGFGLLFGVISPTLPPIPGGPLVAGGVLMPLLWSGLCYGSMGIVNPLLKDHVEWLWFIASQVFYGVAMSLVVISTHKVPIPPAGPGNPPPSGPEQGEWHQ